MIRLWDAIVWTYYAGCFLTGLTWPAWTIGAALYAALTAAPQC